jgi:hypothetical protein
MRTRGMLSVLLAGALIVVLAAGAALAAQQGGDRGEDESAGKGSVSAENGDGSNGGDRTFELEGRPTSVNGFVDLSQQGANPGDLFMFSDELYRTADGQSDSRDSSERIGQADGRCTLVDPNSERFMCTVVSSFENGTIVTEGVLTNDQDSPSPSSVTGGTGEYRGVTGEATLDLSPAEGPHAIRFDLERNGAASQPDREKAASQQQEEEKTQEETEAKAGDTKNNDTNTQSTAEAKSKDANNGSADEARSKDANSGSADEAKGKTLDR